MRRSLVVVAGIVMLGMVGTRAWGQEPASTDFTDLINGYERAAHSSFVGVPTDWSTRHLVFSAPAPGSDAEDKVQQDPRYWLQQIRHAQDESGDSIAAASDDVAISDGKKKKNKKNKKGKKAITKDWSESLGATGASVGAGFFPAKFTFGTSAASCTDFVVFNTSLAGAAAVAATGTGTFANTTSYATETVTVNGQPFTATGVGIDTFATGAITAGQTTTIDGVGYVWEATSCNSFAAPCVVETGTNTTNAANLVAAITNTCSGVTQCKVNAPTTGVWALVSGSTVLVVNTTGAAINWSLSGGTTRQTFTPTGSISNASTSSSTFALSSGTGASTAVTTIIGATNLTTAINDNSSTAVTASNVSGTSATVTLTANTAGTAGNSIATTETMTGFSWGGTTLAGGVNGQASIMAFNDLYTTTCGGTVPETAWAYNTGGTVSTSVALSGNGQQMVFVHSSASGASLEVLRPVVGQGTSAITPVAPGTTSTTGSAYVTCKSGAGSCLLSLAFGNGANDTNSSPYYIYGGTNADTVFVGDDTGYLHKFTNVFNGTPAEVINSDWPAEAAVVKISNPVYNDPSGTVFVVSSFDGMNPGNGGRIHEVNASTGITMAEGNSNILGPWTSGEGGCNSPGSSGDGTPITNDGAIVDSAAGTNGMVYVFMSNNGAGNSAVYQFAPGYMETSCGNMVTVGTGSTTGITLYSGAFDNIYFTSANSAKPSGNMYVCGDTGGQPTLYRIAFSMGAFSGSPVGLTTTQSTATTTCSPVTEFLTGTTDQAFLSVEAGGRPTGCSGGGCVMSFNISTALSSSATPSAAVAESGGSSGIVIDNSATTTGASQIYFSTLTGETAVQASQTGL